MRVLGTGRRSGVEEYTEQVVSHMIPRAPDVQWKLFYSGRTPLQRRSWMEYSNVRVIDTGWSNRMLWLATRLRGRPYLDHMVGGADVFFFPHFLLGALSQNCRRVMTWHDLSYERMPHLLSLHRRVWHQFQMRPRFQAALADKIIAVSQATAQDLQDVYALESERIAVVSSGVDPDLRRVSEVEIQRWRTAQGIDAPFVLALGTREPRKNLPALIAAWDRARRDPALRNLHLVLAGPVGWMEREILQAIGAAHAPHEVHILEHVSREDRATVLSAASALVYPSLMEGFGFPPLEAMACGTPVIASATSSLFETVGDAGLLVDPYRIDSLAGALSALVTDAGLRSRLIARGFDRVSLFTWERAARATLSEIFSVLE